MSRVSPRFHTDPPPLTNLFRPRSDAVLAPRQDSSARPPAADFYVPHVPGLPPNSSLSAFSGHLPSSPDTDAHLFFLLFRNQHIADKQRLVIWLNGGPGCSSFDGALLEVGPVRMVYGEKSKLHLVDHSWTTFSNVLFLDQPAGTGYSYVSTNSYVHELPDAAAQVVHFLERFYETFPEMRSVDTYLAGESYAGQYIPYTADAILNAQDSLKTPLKGALIGNGWISPLHQYKAYLPFAYKNNILDKNSEVAQKIEKTASLCDANISANGTGSGRVSIDACESIMDSILGATMQTVDGRRICINTYDMRLTDDFPACGMNWPPGLKEMYDYLPEENIKALYHASAKEGGWIECSGSVGTNFWTRTSSPSYDLLPSLLDRGLQLLIFAGDQDIICNWEGLYDMVNDLEWSGHKGLTGAQELEWSVDGEKAGSWMSTGGLTWVKVYNASHMVPFDVPKVTHDMLLRFQNVNIAASTGVTGLVSSTLGNDTFYPILSNTTNPAGSPSSSKLSSAEDPADLAASPSPFSSSSSSSSDNNNNNISSSSSEFSEAYYNFGTAAAFLFLLIVGLFGFFFCKKRMVKDTSRYSPYGHTRSSPTIIFSAADDDNGDNNDNNNKWSRRKQTKHRGVRGGAPFLDHDTGAVDDGAEDDYNDYDEENLLNNNNNINNKYNDIEKGGRGLEYHEHSSSIIQQGVKWIQSKTSHGYNNNNNNSNKNNNTTTTTSSDPKYEKLNEFERRDADPHELAELVPSSSSFNTAILPSTSSSSSSSSAVSSPSSSRKPTQQQKPSSSQLGSPISNITRPPLPPQQASASSNLSSTPSTPHSTTSSTSTSKRTEKGKQRQHQHQHQQETTADDYFSHDDYNDQDHVKYTHEDQDIFSVGPHSDDDR